MLYKQEEQRLEQEYRGGMGGIELARRRSDTVDRLVIELFSAAGGDTTGLALVAVGGYGRRELSPQSDVDLLILHSGPGDAGVAEMARGILYPLWDAGLHVGHAVRSVKDTLSSASTDFDLLTAALDARLLAGDLAVFRALRKGIERRAKARAGVPFLRALVDARNRRHAAFGDSACVLEPHVKDGSGGLRDIQSLVWAGKAALGAQRLEDLESAGYLSGRDVKALTEAREFFITARNHLHYLTGRPFDRLTMDLQAEVAGLMGYIGEDHFPPAEQLMRDYYLHASNTEFVGTLFWQHIEVEFSSKRRVRPRRGEVSGDGLSLSDGMLDLRGPASLEQNPGVSMSLFSRSLEEKLPVSPRALQAIDCHVREHGNSLGWTPQVRDDFMTILRAGEEASSTLDTLAHLGLLGRLIPEFERARCRPQYDAYHTYTIDLHCFHTVAELGKIADGAHPEDEPLEAYYRDIENVDALMLAALLHDVGKGYGKGHAAAGARLAAGVVRRIGFSHPVEQQVGFLVRHHLLLAETATRRDIDDESLILSVAGTVKTAERLKALYLLTIADGLATGPKAWTPWKAALVRELFSKTLKVLDEGEAEGGGLSLGARRRSELRKLLRARFGGAQDAVHEVDAIVDAFIDDVPHAYVLANRLEIMASHFELMRGLEPGEVRTAVAEESSGVYGFTLVAANRPDLFCKVAGTLSLHGANILSAHVYTTAQGTAIQVFKVDNHFEGKIESHTWEDVTADARRALGGKISLDYRLAEKLRHYQPKAPPRVETHPTVAIDNESSDFYTVIEVHAEDRIGLLYGVTKAILDLNLAIYLAKASTSANRVVDVFYVRGVDGQKLVDEEQIRDVRRAIVLGLQQRAWPAFLP